MMECERPFDCSGRIMKVEGITREAELGQIKCNPGYVFLVSIQTHNSWCRQPRRIFTKS